MKKLIGSGLLAVALAAPLHAVAAEVSWTNWSSATAGTMTQNGATIDVTFQGNGEGMSKSDYFTGYPDTYTNAVADNGPADNGVLLFSGGTEVEHRIVFSRPVVDPLIAFVSLGSFETPAAFSFVNASDIDLLGFGPGPWGFGAVTVVDHFVSGAEGNGMIRLNGTFTEIVFTTPNYEYWYGATVGVVAVPEPGTWAMLLAGGGLLALLGRRRDAGRLTPPA